MPDQPFSKLLSNKSFVFLWISQILSQLTINLVTFSVISQIYTVTQSTVAVSLMWLAFSLPIFILGPFSGSLVDRLNLRRTMYLTNLFQSIVVFLLVFSNQNLFLLYVLVLVYSAIDRFYIPAQLSAVPWLLPKNLLATANGLFFITQQASIMIGLGLGGVFISLLGHTATVVLSSLFLLLASWAAILLPESAFKIKVGHHSPGIRRFLTDIIQGYRLLNTRVLIKYSFSLVIFLQSLITVIIVLLPSLSYQIIGSNLQKTGIFFIIPAGLGALCSAIYLPRILIRIRKLQVIQTGILFIGICLFVVSLSGWLPQLYKLILVSVASFGLGSFSASSIIPLNTLIQEETPHQFGGRVFGLLGFFGTTATMIPLMTAAALSDVFGTRFILIIISLILFSLYFYLKLYAKNILAAGNRF